MTKARVALFGGMGYPVTESPWGMPQLKTRLETVGAEVLLVNWSHRQDAYNFMHGFDGFRAYMGDSLGAGSAAQYPGDVHGAVDFVAGFQPSVYDARAHAKQITVAVNVARAHAIYNPAFLQTMGLGNATYVPAHGARTIVLNTQHFALHPDDTGATQDLIFNQFVGLLNGPKHA